eukprot:scaffold11797_cov123-Isochrysis_galbana.AAC.14
MGWETKAEPCACGRAGLGRPCRPTGGSDMEPISVGRVPTPPHPPAPQQGLAPAELREPSE